MEHHIKHTYKQQNILTYLRKEFLTNTFIQQDIYGSLVEGSSSKNGMF